MLSSAAFNALLKTLEEPPEHVVFIFATTESHKIPETILGRCQRFDFKRVTVAQISERIKDILKTENIAFEDAALNLIARAAEGSMRDAQSILDQVISFSGLKVTATAVRESIGLIGTELLFSLLKNVLERDAKSALQIVQTAFNQGVDLKVLLKALAEMLHALILIQVGIEKPETHFSEDELNQLATLKAFRALEENELIFQVYHHGLDLLSKAAQPKLIFDLLVIKTALAEEIIRLDDGVSEGSKASEKNTSSDIRREARPSAQVMAPEVAKVTAPVNASIILPATSSVISSGAPEVSAMTATIATGMATAMPSTEPLNQNTAAHFSFHTETPSLAGTKSAPASASVRALPTGAKSWEKFIEFSFAQAPVLGIVLESVVEWTLPEHREQKFTLGFREKDRIKADQLTQKNFREQFMQLTEAYFGFKAPPEVFFSKNNGESLAEKSERVEKEAHDLKMKAILSNEIIQEAKALFGVELTNIEMIERNS